VNGIVFLFDVDNTLLDNDAIQADLGDYLEAEFGRTCREQYKYQKIFGGSLTTSIHHGANSFFVN